MYARHTPYIIYAEQLLKKRSLHLDPGTIRNDTSELKKYAYPILRDIPVCEIDQAQIIQVKKLVQKENFHPDFVDRVRRSVNLPFQHASTHGILEDNPLTKCWKSIHSNASPTIFSYEQMVAVMREAEQNPYRNLIYTAIFTGLSTGELGGLTWDNIDFFNNTITINKILKCSSTVSVPEFQTERYIGYNRILEIEPYIIETFLLSEYESHTRKHAKSNFVFTDNKDHSPITSRIFYQHLKQLKAGCRIPQLSLRNLRSTFAYYECLNGENLALLRHQLGFKNVQSLYPYLNLSNIRKESEHETDY